MTDSHSSPTAPVALVAGGSRGLGLQIAQDLLQRGFQVAVCARDSDELRNAEGLLSDYGTVRGYPCDVSDEEAVNQLVAKVERDQGDIEVLMAVAGVIQVAPLESVSIEHFRESIDVMTWGPIHLTLAVLPGMRQRSRGHIGIVTSVGGLVSPPHLLPYATAKFAAAGFAEGLAAALQGTGVTATNIAPGLMRTGSPERATFAGDPVKEFSWFAPSASLPLLSKSATAAASQMVDAVLAGKPLVLVGWMPKVAARVKGIAPGLVITAMGLANRIVPGTGERNPTLHEGRAVRSQRPSKLRDAVTVLGTRAARRLGQRVGRPTTAY